MTSASLIGATVPVTLRECRPKGKEATTVDGKEENSEWGKPCRTGAEVGQEPRVASSGTRGDTVISAPTTTRGQAAFARPVSKKWVPEEHPTPSVLVSEEMSSPWGMDSSERHAPALPCWATKPGDPVWCTTELVCSEMHGAAARGEALSLLLRLPLHSWGLCSTLGAWCVWCWSPRQRSGPLLRVPEDIPGVGNEVGALGSGTFLAFCPQSRHRLHLSPSFSGSLRSPHPANSRRRGGEDKGTVPGSGCSWCVEIAGNCRVVPPCPQLLRGQPLGHSFWAEFGAGEVTRSSSERHVLTLTSSGNGVFPLGFSLRF